MPARLIMAGALAAVALLTLGGGSARAADVDALWKRSPEELRAGLEDAHPAVYYVLAGRLFQDGRRDEAVFWFYLGQLRYRVHLGARKDLDPSGDPALFGSLSEVVGRPINEYAFGDIPRLVRAVDEVLAWDLAHENRFTPKGEFGPVHAGVRTGLERLRDHVGRTRDEIRRQRTANGLENRD